MSTRSPEFSPSSQSTHPFAMESTPWVYRMEQLIMRGLAGYFGCVLLAMLIGV